MSERDLAHDCERRATAMEGWIETGQVPDGGGNRQVIETLRAAATEIRRLCGLQEGAIEGWAIHSPTFRRPWVFGPEEAPGVGVPASLILRPLHGMSADG